MAEAILNQPHFQDAEKAREYLEALRWANGVICPHCGVIGKHYKLEGKAHRPGVYKCVDCASQFTVTVGTVFESSKIKLHIWLQAVHLMSASKKGISAKQLERMLGVTYKTAWFMGHRIREAMNIQPKAQYGESGAPVEADETYWGNTTKKAAGGAQHKMKIFSLVERGGEKRSFHVTNVDYRTLRPIMQAMISSKARLMTDESAVYKSARKDFAKHFAVNHSKGQYWRIPDITTNSIESSFAILKRGLYGTFHSVSEQHLQRYATEFDFRWNNRAALGVNDSQRTDKALMGIFGKRLTYRA